MSNKIIYKKGDLLGNDSSKSKAIKKIKKQDRLKNVLNQSREKQQLFSELKKYRDGGVTEKELKSALATLKYETNNYFSKSEINKLAQELNIGSIKRRHLLETGPTHTSAIERANHQVNFSNSNSRLAKDDSTNRRKLQSDDFKAYDVKKIINNIYGKKGKKLVMRGNDAYFQNEDEDEYFDRNTGVRTFNKSTKISRPKLNIKAQTSLRGRGLVKN